MLVAPGDSIPAMQGREQHLRQNIASPVLTRGPALPLPLSLALFIPPSLLLPPPPSPNGHSLEAAREIDAAPSTPYLPVTIDTHPRVWIMDIDAVSVCLVITMCSCVGQPHGRHDQSEDNTA